MNSISANLNIMIKASEKASKVLIRDFGEVEKLQVSIKGPSDFVTNADKKAEKIIIEELSKSRKKYSILSEEVGKINNSDTDNMWIIDPIDGTRSFIIGSPTWSNLISINYKNVPIFGLVNFPMLKKYYITGINKTSYLVENNKFKKLKVLKFNTLNSSKIAGNFFGWLSLDEQKKISKLTRLMRYPCSDALSYCQLCEGTLDVVIQCYNKIWDIHPMIPLIKNAGGHITTWEGKDARIGGSIVASSNMKLHKKVLNLLKPVC